MLRLYDDDGFGTASRGDDGPQKTSRDTRWLCTVTRRRAGAAVQRFPGTRGRVVAGVSVSHTVPSAGRVPWMRAAPTALSTHVLVP